MLTTTLLLLNTVLLTMCLLKLHVTHLPMSPTIVYLTVGQIANAIIQTKVLTPPTTPERADILMIITEITMLISLFTIDLQLRIPWTLKDWRVTALLTNVTIKTTIALTTLTK